MVGMWAMDDVGSFLRKQTSQIVSNNSAKFQPMVPTTNFLVDFTYRWCPEFCPSQDEVTLVHPKKTVGFIVDLISLYFMDLYGSYF